MIRNMRDNDASAVLEIYRQGLDSGEASFETEPPDWAKWQLKYHAFCRLVWDQDGEVLGWAALAPVSARHCYRGVAEVSIYVAASAAGRGIGGRLLEALVLEPRTTKQVAEALGEKPTKLYHHVDALEKVGLIRLIRTQRNRGTLEKYYQSVARSFSGPGAAVGLMSIEPPAPARVEPAADPDVHRDPAPADGRAAPAARAAVEGLAGAQERRLRVERFTGPRAEGRGDAQRQAEVGLAQKGRRGRVPGGVAACLEGGADAA